MISPINPLKDSKTTDRTSPMADDMTPTSGHAAVLVLAENEPHSQKKKKEVLEATMDRLLAVDLTNLDKDLLEPSHARLPVLEGTNYHTWADSHKRFLRGRGLWGIVSGDLPMPTTETEARNWMILDQWIAFQLASYVEDSQQCHISHLYGAKDIWDEMNQIHRVSGIGRLVPMLQRFFGYIKGAEESIDQMTRTLWRLSNDICDIAPQARPSDIVFASVMMNACQADEYQIAKHLLGLEKELTCSLVVERLRCVEQDVRYNLAKGNGSK